MKQATIISLLIALLLAAVICSVCIGAVTISGRELLAIISYQLGGEAVGFEPQQEAVFWIIRLPRVLLGVLVGASLAVAGASMQGLFRNPLADPGLIGVSAGASLFAVVMIVLEVKFFTALSGILGFYALSVFAFGGAALTTLIVYRLSKTGGKAIIATMLLAGIAINALAGALTGLLTYTATDAQLRSIVFWGLGSLGGASWESVAALAPFALLPLIALPRLSKALNALALGESEAGYLGVNVKSLKRQVIFWTTMAVGSSVAVAGTIGFIGLVIPHLLRLFAGADHKLILPASALLGAAVLTTSDLISRTAVAPSELPIGIITAMLGTPFFLWILMKEKRRMTV
ncbi:FecCD family ABC transporter permease [Rhodoflexus sp.]